MKRTLFILSFIWLLLLGTSYFWNYINLLHDQDTIKFQTAKSFFTQILITRRWNAEHGGVYVPVTKTTKPNPFLIDPKRDLIISKDLRLTKINPAYMTRQISELASESDSIRFHITSLNPIRPANKASFLEEKALHEFQNGLKEFSEIIGSGTERKFFYMAPLLTEKSCLKCHAVQGYKEGDIRGGISVIIPYTRQVNQIIAGAIGHSVIGLVGLLGIIFFGNKLYKAYEIIKTQAITDTLTGIPNKRSFNLRIMIEYNRSNREKYPLSVLLIDFDKFKLYNDTYGHEVGDDCMKNVACGIRNSLKRSTDFCARFGGDEFVVILPNTNLGAAVRIAEQILANVQDMKIPHQKQPGGVVTVSIGAAEKQPGESISDVELITRSDKALYSAKGKGGNCVISYNIDNRE